MSKEQDLKKLEQESFRDLNRDGLNEANIGMLIIFWFNALYLGIPENQSIATAWLGLILVAFFAVYTVFIFLYYQVYRKKHVYPRIGYVKLREIRSLKAILGAVAILILVVAEEIALIHMLSTGIVTIDWIYRWVPTIFGVTSCTFGFILKFRSGQNRYYIVSILFAITGFILALAEFISAEIIPIIYFDGWGITFIVTGIIKFVLFIRKYPIIETPEVE